MEGYKIEFEIYADNVTEADDARKAIIGFISEMAYNGCAVRGYKITKALRSWRSNAFIRDKVLDYFRPKVEKSEDDGKQQ